MSDKQFKFSVDWQQEGPVPETQIMNMFDEGQVNEDTLFCTEEMSECLSASEIVTFETYRKECPPLPTISTLSVRPCIKSPKKNEKMKHMWIPQVIISLMLLWALNPENPYGYYILLRWVCCAVFAYLAFQAFAKEEILWVWVLGVAAAIYNPIVRIHLTREIWSIVNVVTIIFAIASIFVLKPKRTVAN